MRSPLVDAAALHRRIAAAPPVILDIRWTLATGAQPDAYERGHIPTAVFVDLDAELSAPAGRGGRHPLPTGEAFAAAMNRAGVRADRDVVVYDDANGLPAARAWWLLRYFGQRRVALLDGGLAAWVAAGYRLQAGSVRAASPGAFTAKPGGMPVLDADGAGALAAAGILLDARAPERFTGEHEPMDPVGGHIPGARNWPMGRNLDPDGRFLAPDVLAAGLRELTDALGDHPGASDYGAYCGSGITAAHAVLALELAGIQAALYPGSWSEWVTDPARPVATGREQPA